MEKVKMLFVDSSNNNKSLEAYESGCEIFISIEDEDNFIGIQLNRTTAIRLVRELKKQIGNIKTNE